MLAASLWATAEPIIAVASVIAAVATVFATRGIQKARIDGLEGTLETATSNVEQLREALRLQHDKHEVDRIRDREECDRQIRKAEELAQHALQEASAARSEVVGAVTEAATKAVLAVQRDAMSKASVALAAGQQQIIDRLDRIEGAMARHE